MTEPRVPAAAGLDPELAARAAVLAESFTGPVMTSYGRTPDDRKFVEVIEVASGRGYRVVIDTRPDSPLAGTEVTEEIPASVGHTRLTARRRLLGAFRRKASQEAPPGASFGEGYRLLVQAEEHRPAPTD